MENIDYEEWYKNYLIRKTQFEVFPCFYEKESPMDILNHFNGWGAALYFKVKEDIINELKYIGGKK